MASKTESRRSKKKGKKNNGRFFRIFKRRKKENLNKMKSLNDNKCQRFRFFPSKLRNHFSRHSQS
jgi:hypothetical protein